MRGNSMDSAVSDSDSLFAVDIQSMMRRAMQPEAECRHLHQEPNYSNNTGERYGYYPKSIQQSKSDESSIAVSSTHPDSHRRSVAVAF
jgi:hypothetical protein